MKLNTIHISQYILVNWVNWINSLNSYLSNYSELHVKPCYFVTLHIGFRRYVNVNCSIFVTNQYFQTRVNTSFNSIGVSYIRNKDSVKVPIKLTLWHGHSLHFLQKKIAMIGYLNNKRKWDVEITNGYNVSTDTLHFITLFFQAQGLYKRHQNLP